MSRRGAPFVLVVLAFVLDSSRAGAQDSNYWTLQYGPVAELLGGVVVGSTRDLSATYYNPGALALTTDPSLLASVESFEMLHLDGSQPPLVDFRYTTIRPSPSLFAFAFPRSWTGRHTLAISSLTRQDLDIRVDNWQVAAGQGGAEALFDQNLGENWFGLSWAYPAGEQIGVGLTTYVVYRGQRTRREIHGAATTGANQGGAAMLVDDLDYSHYRLLWKAGVSLQREAWDLGLAFTTPSVALFGSGSASYTRSAVGANLGSGPTVAVSVRHEPDLKATFQSPWSVALGGAYRRGQNTFHGTTEWFGKVGGYDVLDTSPFGGDPAAAALVKRLHQQADSVFNFGVGYDRKVNESFSYYAAFTTDFTFADKEDSGTNALSTWDIYHLTAGISFFVAQVKLTVGAAYAFGGDTRTVATLVVPEAGSPPVLTDVPLDTRFMRFRMMVGFDFGR
jgi:hypothetical protein